MGPWRDRLTLPTPVRGGRRAGPHAQVRPAGPGHRSGLVRGLAYVRPPLRTSTTIPFGVWSDRAAGGPCQPPMKPPDRAPQPSSGSSRSGFSSGTRLSVGSEGGGMIACMGTDASGVPSSRAIGRVLGLNQAPKLPDPDTADAVHLRHNISRTPKHPNIAFQRGRRGGSHCDRELPRARGRDESSTADLPPNCLALSTHGPLELLDRRLAECTPEPKARGPSSPDGQRSALKATCLATRPLSYGGTWSRLLMSRDSWDRSSACRIAPAVIAWLTRKHNARHKSGPS